MFRLAENTHHVSLRGGARTVKGGEVIIDTPLCATGAACKTMSLAPRGGLHPFILGTASYSYRLTLPYR